MSINVALFICALLPGTAAVTSGRVNASDAFLQHNSRLSDDAAVAVAVASRILPAKWSSTSKFAPVVQYFFAGVWILMIACLPSIVPLMNKKKPTKSQIIVGVIMLVVFLGGLGLFTNIILFQSVHFERIRPLTIIECMYFMSQVITTVGYGDITPAKVRGQVFVGLYVLGAMFVISMVVSDVLNQVVEAVEKRKDRLLAHAKKNGINDLLHLQPKERPSITDVLLALAIFAAIDIVWVMFFSLYPGEDKNAFQALYMSVITLSSVGFGAFTPLTEEGMIFAAYFMIFGCCALVNVIGQFTELMVKLNNFEKHNLEIEKEDATIVLDGQCHMEKGVSDLEFLKFCVLQMHHVEESHLDVITEAFQKLKPVNGLADQATIKKEILGIID